ncbi:MAG: outer membrane protein transport protein [Gammaproteobacteria bacterium]|nr:outer membrane protein transport protein [Gammaproteobacteria bacterium]
MDTSRHSPRLKLKKYVKISLACFALSAASISSASNFQNFAGINYTNPAELSILVQDASFILGYDYIIPEVRWNGTITVPSPLGGPSVVTTGKASNNSNFDLPYGRFAKRINPQWVVGLDITPPFKSVIKYSPSSNARYATVNTSVQSTNYSPSVSYQFAGWLDKLSVGIGLDVMEVWAALDQMYPSLTFPFGAGPDNTIRNHGSGWAYGWHAGAFYHALKGTFVGLSYFSASTSNLQGISSFTGFADSNQLNARLKLPATTSLSVTQFFSQDWFVRGQVRLTQWRRLRQVILNGLSGPNSSGILLLNYHNTWEAELSTKYNFNSQFYLGGFLAYDQSPTNNTDRTLALPEVNRVVLAVAPGYKFNKAVSAELHYAHVFTVKTSPLNNVSPNNGTTTVGKAKLSADAVGIQFNYNI